MARNAIDEASTKLSTLFQLKSCRFNIFVVAIAGILMASMSIPVRSAELKANSPVVAQPAQASVKRMTVRRFELANFQAQPKLGWTQAVVDELLARALERQNEFSLAELDAVAQSLSVRMKQLGLMFGRASIPDQQISNDTVLIEFEQGKLGEVVVMDAQRIQPAVLARPFKPLLQQSAVRQELDDAILHLDYLPGVEVFGFFSVTEEPGVARLNLRVMEEAGWSASIGTDNYGNAVVGQERLFANLSILNPSGWGDQLGLKIGRSYSQPGFFDGAVEYSIPLGRAFAPLRFSLSNSDYELGQGFEMLEVFGRSTSASLGFVQSIDYWPSRYSWFGQVGKTISKVDSTLSSEDFFSENDVVDLKFGATWYYALSERLQQSLRGSATFGTSEVLTQPNGQLSRADNTFSMLELGYQLLLTPKRATASSVNSGLKFTTRFSQDLLPAVNRLGFGGVDGVRGLDSGFFSADNGVLGTIWYGSKLWAEHLPGQLQLFTDFGQGTRFANESTFDQTAQFASVGVGWRFTQGPWDLRTDLGKVIHLDFDRGGLSVEDQQQLNDQRPAAVFFSLAYTFEERS